MARPPRFTVGQGTPGAGRGWARRGSWDHCFTVVPYASVPLSDDLPHLPHWLIENCR
jgi:hypothetical protein